MKCIFIFAMGDKDDCFVLYAVKPNGAVWTEIGTATFWVTPKTIRCRAVFVEPEWRRKGVATAMYRYATGAVKGKKLRRSWNQTCEGRAFWKNLPERLKAYERP